MGRRPQIELSRRLIAKTALAIFDEEGGDAVTVRRIAARLDVRSPSLYNHIGSKEEILDEMTLIIGEQIDLSPLSDPDWRIGIVDFARSYRAAFRGHADALAVIARRPVDTTTALGVYDAVLARLIRAGWSPREALLIVGAVEYAVLGSILVPFRGGFVHPSHDYAENYPALAASLEVTDPRTVDDDAFEASLELLVSGLQARRAAGEPLHAGPGR